MWGAGSLEAAFGNHERIVVPWDLGGWRFDTLLAARQAIARVLNGPPAVADIDPRQLLAGQRWVLKGHTGYYLADTWYRSGTTSADRHLAANRYPLVHINAAGRPVLFGGHHRALAALLRAGPLRARVAPARGVGAVTVLPLLLVGEVTYVDAWATDNGRFAADLIDHGYTALVPNLDTAHQALVYLDLPAQLIHDRLTMATHGVCTYAL